MRDQNAFYDVKNYYCYWRGVNLTPPLMRFFQKYIIQREVEAMFFL